MKKLIYFFVFLIILPNGFSILQAKISVNADAWYNARVNSNYDGYNVTAFFAPMPVFFEGWESTDRDSIISYFWDFGDNTTNLTGSGMFNAFHIYEDTGTFYANLTIMNSSGVNSSANMTIIVYPRNGTNYYVDSVIGNDSCDGKNDTAINATTCPWQTATKAFSSMGTKTCPPIGNDTNCNQTTGIYNQGDQILFNRGQIFTYQNFTSVWNGTGFINKNYVANPGHGKSGYGYLFGSYGAGNKPIIKPDNDTDASVILMYQTGNGLAWLVIRDLHFVGQLYNGTTVGEIMFTSQETNQILYYNVDFSNVSRALVFSNKAGQDGSGSTNYNVISGVYFINNTISNSSIGTSFFAAAHRLALVDTSMDYSDNHQVYISFLNKGVIYNNSFKRGAFGVEPFRISAASGGYSWIPSDMIYIAKNKFLGWIDPLKVGTRHNGQGIRYYYSTIHLGANNNENQTLSNIMFEDNIVTNGETLMHISDMENLTIRNNIFMTNNTDPEGGASNYLYLTSKHGYERKPNAYIKILGNTFAARGFSTSVNSFIYVENYSKTTPHPFSYANILNYTIMDNIFYVKGSGTNPKIIYVDVNQTEVIQNITSDYNLFYSDTNNESKIQFRIGTTNYNLTQWRDVTQKDGNSTIGDPLFIDLNGADNEFSESRAFDANLSLSSGSPAINKGINLTELMYYDYTFIPRFYYSVWDIGAFEFRATLSGDTIPPYFIHMLSNFTIFEATPFTYDINATDDVSAVRYFINETFNFTINNESGILTNRTITSSGLYYINVSINDSSNNQNSSIIFINVTVDNDYPYFNHTLQNFTYEANVTSFSYDINATDNSGYLFFSVDDITNFQIDTNGIVTNKVTLPVNTYSLNITISDYKNNQNSSIFQISVLSPATNPTITLNSPVNTTSFNDVGNITLDFTVNQSETHISFMKLYGFPSSNINNYLNYLIYQQGGINVLTTITYNWTAPVIQSDSNTILLYHFDNNTLFNENTSLIYDFSGNGNNGTISSGVDKSLSDGKLAGSFSFDLVGDYINILNSSSLNINQTFTIQLWVKPSSLTGTKDYILYKGSPTNQYTLLWDWNETFEDQVVFYSIGFSGDDPFLGVTLPDLSWHNIAFTYDGITIKGYLDGVLSNSKIADFGLIPTNNNMTISRPTSTFYFGAIDELVIKNATLSADEVLNNYRLQGSGTQYAWIVNVTDGSLETQSLPQYLTVGTASQSSNPSGGNPSKTEESIPQQESDNIETKTSNKTEIVILGIIAFVSVIYIYRKSR